MKVNRFAALTLASALVLFAVIGTTLAFAQTPAPTCYPIPAEGCEPTTPPPTTDCADLLEAANAGDEAAAQLAEEMGCNPVLQTPNCEDLLADLAAGEIGLDEVPEGCVPDCGDLEQAAAAGVEGAQAAFDEQCSEMETGVLAEGGILASGLALISLLSLASGGLLVVGARRGRRR